MARLIATLLLIIGIFVLIHKCQDKPVEGKSNPKDSTSLILHELSRQAVASAKTQEALSVTLNELKEYKYLYAQLKTELSKLGLKPQAVHNYTTVNTTALDSVVVEIHDTLYQAQTAYDTTINFRHKSEFLTLTGRLSTTVLPNAIVARNAEVSYSLVNRQSIVVAERRESWYKPRKTFVTVVNENPAVTTDKVQSIELKPTGRKGLSFAAGMLTGAVGVLILAK